MATVKPVTFTKANDGTKIDLQGFSLLYKPEPGSQTLRFKGEIQTLITGDAHSTGNTNVHKPDTLQKRRFIRRMSKRVGA